MCELSDYVYGPNDSKWLNLVANVTARYIFRYQSGNLLWKWKLRIRLS